MFRVYIFLFGCLVSVFLSCNSLSIESKKNPLLAEVLHEKLMFDDIKNKIPEDINSVDSVALVGSLTEAWIQKTLLTKASRNLYRMDKSIDALTEDYRNALIIHKYEQQLLSSQLDSSFTQSEIQKYYEAEKMNFKLDQSVYLIQYAVVDEKVNGLDRFFESWKSNDLDKTKAFCDKNALDHCLQDSCWLTADEIVYIEVDNPFKKSDLRKENQIQRNRKGKEYFLKIIDIVEEDEVAPMKYIENDLKKVLLFKRKKNLLKNHTQELYRDLLADNKIKNYLKLGK